MTAGGELVQRLIDPREVHEAARKQHGGADMELVPQLRQHCGPGAGTRTPARIRIDQIGLSPRIRSDFQAFGNLGSRAVPVFVT